jgi:glyoxylase-like metal-dependent hydrolase (beta-lactamase superfamily II)
VEAKLAPLAHAGSLELIPFREQELAPGITVLPTPGHTPGHFAVKVETGAGTALILGDAAVHPLQVTRPTLPYALDEDLTLAAKTRASLLDWVGEHDLRLFAGHFPGPGGGTLRRSHGRRAHSWGRPPKRAKGRTTAATDLRGRSPPRPAESRTPGNRPQVAPN